MMAIRGVRSPCKIVMTHMLKSISCPEHLGGALGRGKGDSVGSASVIG